MEQAGHPSRAFGCGVSQNKGSQVEFGQVFCVESLYLQHGQGRLLTCNAPDEVYASQQLVAYNCVRMHAAAIRRRLGLTGSDLPDLWRVGADVITVTSPKCLKTNGSSGGLAYPSAACLPACLRVPACLPARPCLPACLPLPDFWLACLPACSNPPACLGSPANH